MTWLVPRDDSQWTPLEWFLSFRRETALPLARWLAFGRYKHVSCFGYVAGPNVWLFHDYWARRTDIAVIPDDRAGPMLVAMSDGALVVRWRPPMRAAGTPIPFAFKPLFLCTSAVAHVAAIPSCALRPDRLLRDCLARGGEIVVRDEPHEPQPDQARSAASG